MHIILDDIWRREIRAGAQMGPWECLSPALRLPCPLDGATAHRLGHMLYVVCGQTKRHPYGFADSGAVWRLDLQKGVWLPPVLPPDSFRPRVWHNSAVLKGPLPSSWLPYLSVAERSQNGTPIFTDGSSAASPIDAALTSLLDQDAILICAGRSISLEYFNDAWVLLTRTFHWLPLPSASSALPPPPSPDAASVLMEARGPQPRAAHASVVVCVEGIGRCLLLFGGRFRLAAWDEDSEEDDDEGGDDDSSESDANSDDEMLDQEDRVAREPRTAAPRRQSHMHFNDVWIHPLEGDQDLSWRKLSVTSAAFPRRRSCLSLLLPPSSIDHPGDKIAIYGGYTCSNFNYRYYGDSWLLHLLPDGRACHWTRLPIPQSPNGAPTLSIHSVAPSHRNHWVYLFGTSSCYLLAPAAVV